MIIASVLLVQTSATADEHDDACYDAVMNANGQTCDPWNNTTVTLYPSLGKFVNASNCPIEVNYSWRKCEKTIGCGLQVSFQVNVRTLDWDWSEVPGTPCFSLMSILYPGFPDNFGGLDFADLGDLLSDLHAQLMLKVGVDYYENLRPEDQVPYQCVGDPCETPTEQNCALLQVYASAPTCKAACVYISDDNNEIYIKFKRCIGNEDICCVRKQLFCWCDGELKTTEIIEVPLDGFCEETEPVTPGCPDPLELGLPFSPNVIQHIDCGNTCNWEWINE
jgi:hypothetical protein